MSGLVRRMESTEILVRKYDDLIHEANQLQEEMLILHERLDDNTLKYMDQCRSLLEVHENRMRQEIARGVANKARNKYAFDFRRVT